MAYVPHPIVKEIMKQHEGLDAREKWITNIREYDLEIQPTKLVKGRGLARLLAEGNKDLSLKEDVPSMISTVMEGIA